ncbi:MAG TPA: hypothetical protein VKA91_02095, partial [Nitrososphaeraceae archaeon]|nr:hypothetical protein [Nitrososphaeraceae archaeon]
SNNSNSNYRIKTESLQEIIRDYSNDIQSLIIGIRLGHFTNQKIDFEKLHNNTQVMTVGEAVDSMIRDIMSSKLSV